MKLFTLWALKQKSLDGRSQRFCLDGVHFRFSYHENYDVTKMMMMMMMKTRTMIMYAASGFAQKSGICVRG